MHTIRTAPCTTSRSDDDQGIWLPLLPSIDTSAEPLRIDAQVSNHQSFKAIPRSLQVVHEIRATDTQSCRSDRGVDEIASRGCASR